MGRKKAIRMEEAHSFEKILREDPNLSGKWCDYFNNENPIIIEVGCGKGDYTLGLAQSNKDKNYIGIDKKIYRLWFAARKAQEEEIDNVVFLNNGAENLNEIFAPEEISEIWITFPDPYPKDRHEDRRLTSPPFLDIYKKILKKGGLVHLKTDNLALFNFSCDSAKQHDLKTKTTDLYSENNLEEAKAIQTYYEKRYLAEGKKICYLCFSFN